MSFFNQDQINNIIDFAFAAGKIALSKQKSRDFQTTLKADKSEVTTADIEISKFLHEKLTNIFPEILLICEERKLREFDDEIFWLIDPIDGTKGFIAGSDEFAINIALIKNNKPIFGLIYAPSFEGGKMIVLNEKNNILIGNENIGFKNLETKINPRKHLKILSSNRTPDIEILQYVKQFHFEFIDNLEITKLASAVKFIPLLENEADLYIGLRPTMEWDIASGHALVKFAGGNLKNLMIQNSSYAIGDELLYKKPNFANNFFVSYGPIISKNRPYIK